MIVFRDLFAVGNQGAWNEALHGMSYQAFALQASLPQRFAGCGRLRNSHRTANAAYWASWADTIAVIRDRFPAMCERMLDCFSRGGAVQVLIEAEQAGAACETAGWDWRPDWASLANGLRPPVPDPSASGRMGGNIAPAML